MTASVVAVEPETSVTEIARLMVERHISGVPVVDNGRIVGIVTEADLVSKEIDVDPPAYGTFLDAVFRLPWDRSDDELRRVLATTASELMTKDVVTVRDTATIHDVANVMFKRHINPVPVVDSRGHLVGIVSRSDIIRFMIAE